MEVEALKTLYPLGSQHWVRVLSVGLDGKVALTAKGVTQRSSKGGPPAGSAGVPEGSVPKLFSIHSGETR